MEEYNKIQTSSNKIVKYLNLTNGLEYLDEVKDFKLIRIQSSLCESKCWDRLIRDLDYNFLFDLAQGKIVQVYDTSSKKKETRALYQGLEFIKYVLLRRWFNKENIHSFVKGHNVTEYFERQYNTLKDETKKRLDYIKKFLNTDTIHLESYCKKSLYDGQYDYYKELVKANY